MSTFQEFILIYYQVSQLKTSGFHDYNLYNTAAKANPKAVGNSLLQRSHLKEFLPLDLAGKEDFKIITTSSVFFLWKV